MNSYVLKDIHFILQPGETVAIVGHTGSGKTSIISLMNRLYHIQKGEIRIDDVNIEDYQAGYTAKEYWGCFAGCISCFRVRSWIISPCGIRNFQGKGDRAAKLIDMHDFIMQLPGGYDYNVMERGSTFLWVNGNYCRLSRALTL